MASAPPTNNTAATAASTKLSAPGPVPSILESAGDGTLPAGFSFFTPVGVAEGSDDDDDDDDEEDDDSSSSSEEEDDHTPPHPIRPILNIYAQYEQKLASEPANLRLRRERRERRTTWDYAGLGEVAWGVMVDEDEEVFWECVEEWDGKEEEEEEEEEEWFDCEGGEEEVEAEKLESPQPKEKEKKKVTGDYPAAAAEERVFCSQTYMIAGVRIHLDDFDDEAYLQTSLDSQTYCVAGVIFSLDDFDPVGEEVEEKEKEKSAEKKERKPKPKTKPNPAGFEFWAGLVSGFFIGLGIMVYLLNLY